MGAIAEDKVKENHADVRVRTGGTNQPAAHSLIHHRVRTTDGVRIVPGVNDEVATRGKRLPGHQRMVRHACGNAARRQNVLRLGGQRTTAKQADQPARERRRCRGRKVPG